MWQKRLLMIKYDGVTSNLFGWSRYRFCKKYSNEVTSKIINDTANLEVSEQLTENETSNTNDSVTPTCLENIVTASREPKQRRRRQQKNDEEEPSIMMFPGQGCIKVGQIKNYLKFSRVKDMFKTANKILGYDLLDICLHGPQNKLDMTEFNQPATLVQSLAAVEKLWEEKPKSLNSCTTVLGYSVGEITALVFAGSISVEDGIKLAQVRGKGMQAASTSGKQGMMSILLKSQAKMSRICDESTKWAMDMGVSVPVCSVAIHQSPKVKIIAGHEEALQYIEKNIVALELRQFERLPITGAFHTVLMEPAMKSLRKALDKINVDQPRIEVYSNWKARPYDSEQEVKKLLLHQMVSPIKWEQILHILYNNKNNIERNDIPRTFEMGSGGCMKSMIEKFNLKAAAACITI